MTMMRMMTSVPMPMYMGTSLPGALDTRGAERETSLRLRATLTVTRCTLLLA